MVSRPGGVTVEWLSSSRAFTGRPTSGSLGSGLEEGRNGNRGLGSRQKSVITILKFGRYYPSVRVGPEVGYYPGGRPLHDMDWVPFWSGHTGV